MQARIPRIGLTGGIGSGKSTVANILRDLGAAVVDADAIARSVSDQGGSAVPALHARYGAAFVTPDHGLNRPAMRDMVLKNPQARQELEHILRPYILQGIADAVELAEQQADTQAVVLDIPLLVENLEQWRPHIDTLWVVDCPPELQISRVLARPSSQGWSQAQVQAVLAVQATRAQRQLAADVVLDNGAAISLLDLRRQVQLHWQAITSRQ